MSSSESLSKALHKISRPIGDFLSSTFQFVINSEEHFRIAMFQPPYRPGSSSNLKYFIFLNFFVNGKMYSFSFSGESQSKKINSTSLKID